MRQGKARMEVRIYYCRLLEFSNPCRRISVQVGASKEYLASTGNPVPSSSSRREF